MSEGPFQALCDLEQRSQASSLGLPLQRDVTRPDWYGIGFKSLGTHFVTPLNEVLEIVSRPIMTAVPNVVTWMKGIAQLRSQLLPVTDLQGFLSGEVLDQSIEGHILVVYKEWGLSGLLVEKLLGLQRFQKKEIGPIGVGINEIFLPFIQGQFLVGDQTWFIFSVQALSESKNFYQITKND